MHMLDRVEIYGAVNRNSKHAIDIYKREDASLNLS